MYKILIIDDEYIIREGLRLAIDWTGMDCEIVGEAEDGDEGLKLVQELKPHIIFTDIRMPGISGLEMISLIKKEKQNCKIIILSGFRDFEYAREAIRLGAFRFMVKPSKEDEIIGAVKDAIEEIKKQKINEKVLNNYKSKIAQYYVLENDGAEDEDGDGDAKVKSNYLVKRAIIYMKENYKANISLQIVSDKLYISTWHLSKILKKETGSTFIDLLNSIRIQEAKKLLEEPQYKIYEVCELIGFADVAYFVKLFKKLSGITPTEYRNNLNEK
jgi:two-component system, response regulator YesN